MLHRAVMTLAEVDAFLDREFPQVRGEGSVFSVEAVGPMYARTRSAFRARQVRPGGTISGPTIMALADLSLYVAVLASTGPAALAVTTNLSFNFLRRPAPKDLVAECRLLRLGRRLAVGEVAIRSDGEEDLVAHATGTYAIPRQIDAVS